MKRIVFVIIAALLLLSACGSETQTSPEAPKQEPEPIATEAPVAETAPVEETIVEETVPAETEPVVLVDTDDAVFIVKGLTEDFEIKVYCENKTDKTVLFAVEDSSVNGYMMDFFWSERLRPGTKVNSTIYLYQESLDENGITEIEDISFLLLVLPEIEDHVYEREEAFVEEYFSYAP